MESETGLSCIGECDFDGQSLKESVSEAGDNSECIWRIIRGIIQIVSDYDNLRFEIKRR